MEGFNNRDLVGESPAFFELMQKLPQIAESNSSVLIVGETGTGKEVFARRIHQLSARGRNPFVAVNCGAIPPELAENELFGHKGGAFTGAAPFKTGLISEAEGGTLFLDEINGFSPVVQVKLLRFLEDKTYRPLGCAKEQRADVRVIAALNEEPETLIRAGRLRLDLYYRLNIFSLKLPTLSERADDIPLLARYFLRGFSHGMRKQISDYSETAMQRLLSHNWPGNVRELEHVIERAVIYCDSEVIRKEDIILDTLEMEETRESFQQRKSRLIRQFEIDYIEKLLLVHRGNVTRAAAAASKDRRAFSQLIRKYGINSSRFKAALVLCLPGLSAVASEFGLL